MNTEHDLVNYMVVDFLTGHTTSLFIGNRGPQIPEMFSFVMHANKPSCGFDRLAERLESMLLTAREEGCTDAAGLLEAFRAQSGLDVIARTPTGLSLPSPPELCAGSPAAVERARQAITHFVVDMPARTVTAYQRFSEYDAEGQLVSPFGLWPFEPNVIESWSDFIRSWKGLDISDLPEDCRRKA